MAVALDQQLLDILACPAPHHAPLRPGTAGDPDADALTCTACGRSFPIVDGIPVLLLDEATPPTATVDEPTGEPTDPAPGAAGGAPGAGDPEREPGS